MQRRTLYYRNENGRYEKAGIDCPPAPDGLHLVYVTHDKGCTSTITYYRLNLDEVDQKAFVAIHSKELTDLVYKACQLYPAEKLTEEEWAEWEAFKQTKAGKKLCKGMYRKSAADIAKHILEEMVDRE